MFYPSITLDEIMPDVLVQAAYNGLEKTTKDCITYITQSTAKLGRMVMETISVETICETEVIKDQHTYEGTRGVIPQNVLLHPMVDYCYRYGSVTLCGLDNQI